MLAYVFYSVFVISLTIFVSHHLFKSGFAFMMDIFNNRADIAGSTNKLFQIGYLLFGLGIGFVLLESHEVLDSFIIAFEVMAKKMGIFAIILGVLLFGYMYLFFRGKRVSAEKRAHSQMMEIEPGM